MSRKKRAVTLPKEADGWEYEGGLLFRNFESEPCAKILGFDMDSTLIKTKSGKTFAVSKDDWVLLYDNIPEKIQQYHSDGFRIVIFTNQAGIARGKTDANDIKYKISKIIEALNVPVLAFVATGDDEYRKPGLGMWNFLQNRFNPEIDISQSIYVGDAAGRPARQGRKKDFNDTDLKFALNIGVDFQTPEKFFLNQRDTWPTPQFDPSTIPRSGSVFQDGEEDEPVGKEEQEMIIFVGSPGSGKSTFWNNHLSHYTRVNNDTLKSRDRCLRVAESALASGQSCVIDNTNPDNDARKAYIKLAQKYNVPVRAFIFYMPKDVAFHLDTLRLVNKHRNHLSSRVGSMPIHTFYKKYEKPTTEEGFSEIKIVRLIGGPFDSEEDERMFYSYVYS